MRHSTKVFLSIAAGLVLLTFGLSAEVWRNHFDADGPGSPPAFFDFEVLGPASPAMWFVIADKNPPSAPNQLTQGIRSRAEGSVAVAIRRNVKLEDGKVSLAVKKMPAWGGLVFRMAGDKDFIVLLVDGRSGESRLTAYHGGVPQELAHGKVVVDQEWGDLSVTLAGPDISAVWNEKELFRAKDPKPVSGRVAIANQGPGPAAFDEFVIQTP